MAKARQGDTPTEYIGNNTYNVKRLLFLQNFMTEVNLTVPMAAERMGLSRQAVYRWFKTDDAKVSSLERFFESCGYRMVLDFEMERQQRFHLPEDKVEKRRDLPYDGPKKLGFIKDALSRYKINRKELADRMEVGYTTIGYWIQQDDCTMSYLCKMAECGGMKLCVWITENDGSPKPKYYKL